jgi:HAD superfamily hydrolase (TIGR01509 family)
VTSDAVPAGSATLDAPAVPGPAVRFPGGEPIEAVLFDFHATLVDQGEPGAWLELAWTHAGRAGTAADALDPVVRAALLGWVDEVWGNLRAYDPRNERDLSPQAHRRLYDELIRDVPDLGSDLADALYEVAMEPWLPYDDAVPTLRGLRERGIRTGLVSNIAMDVRPVLARGGMLDLLDAVVLSFEVGVSKPEPGVFARALAALGAAPERTLMVGDSLHDDAGAAALGIRTLILPRTAGPRHGLDLVLRLVG